MVRLTEKCRRSDYCYANGPKIKIAVIKPEWYATLSSENGNDWGFVQLFILDFFIIIVTSFKFFRQSDQIKHQNVRNQTIF